MIRYILIFLLTLPLFSESIILDDGNILKREIISMDVNFIHCKNAEGIEEKISRDKVIRVVYKEINTEDLRDLLTEEEKNKIEKKKEVKAKEIESGVNLFFWNHFFIKFNLFLENLRGDIQPKEECGLIVLYFTANSRILFSASSMEVY